MALVEVVENQNVVARVASLPLISSAYVMVSNVYCNTKDNHPYIKSVCEVAEMGVKTITSAALSSAQPIIGKLEPQIAIANDLACKGLDKIEMTLPILQQPSGQIIASAKEAVTGAKDAVSVTVSGAKDAVSHTLTGVMDRTRGAVQGSVEMTRAVVSEGVRLVSSGMDTALTTSEGLVEQYLPRSEEELEKEVKMMKGSDGDAPSYYVRLGSLSSTLRQRAYQRAVGKVRDAKQRSQESISQLSHTVDMIEFARKNIDGASQTIHEKLSSLVEWTTGQKNGENGDGHEAEQIESRTLAIARRLTQQLQTTCLGLASSLQGLPQHVQDQALSVSSSAVEVYASFSKASAFGDLPDTVLTSSRAQLSKMKDSLDDVMDYLVNNTPLNWLVGPFYQAQTEPSTRQKPESDTQKTVHAEVEMKSLDCNQ